MHSQWFHCTRCWSSGTHEPRWFHPSSGPPFHAGCSTCSTQKTHISDNCQAYTTTHTHQSQQSSAYSLKAWQCVLLPKCLFTESQTMHFTIEVLITESLTMRFTIEVPIHWKPGYVVHYCSACSLKAWLCVSLLKCLSTESQAMHFTIEVLITESLAMCFTTDVVPLINFINFGLKKQNKTLSQNPSQPSLTNECKTRHS